MNRLISTMIILFAFSLQLYSQDIEIGVKDAPDSMKASTQPFGGFAGPVFKYTSTNSEMGMMLGGHAAIMINQKYGIGIGSYGLAGNVDETGDNGEEYDLFTSMIGVELHRIDEPGKLVHLMGTLFIGRGKAQIDPKELDLGLEHSSDVYFAISPSVYIELNVTPVIMLNGGIGYCLALGVDDGLGVTGKDLSGLFISTSLAIGWF